MFWFITPKSSSYSFQFINKLYLWTGFYKRYRCQRNVSSYFSANKAQSLNVNMSVFILFSRFSPFHCFSWYFFTIHYVSKWHLVANLCLWSMLLTSLILSGLECQAGDVGTLLLVNPVGQNELDHSGLLSEAAKVFGLRSRRLKLYLDQDFTSGKILFKAKLTITIKQNSTVLGKPSQQYSMVTAAVLCGVSYSSNFLVHFLDCKYSSVEEQHNL